MQGLFAEIREQGFVLIIALQQVSFIQVVHMLLFIVNYALKFKQ